MIPGSCNLHMTLVSALTTGKPNRFEET